MAHVKDDPKVEEQAKEVTLEVKEEEPQEEPQEIVEEMEVEDRLPYCAQDFDPDVAELVKTPKVR